MNLPFVTAQFHKPEFRVPDLHVPEGMDPRSLASKAGDAGASIRSNLPDGKQLAYYTGLGAAAAFGVMEWPVALAIGAGTAIARQASGSASTATPSASSSSQSVQPTSETSSPTSAQENETS